MVVADGGGRWWLMVAKGGRRWLMVVAGDSPGTLAHHQSVEAGAPKHEHSNKF